MSWRFSHDFEPLPSIHAGRSMLRPHKNGLRTLRVLLKPRLVLFARRLLDCGCSCGGSTTTSCERARLVFWFHPQLRRELGPIRGRFLQAQRPLLRVFPGNSFERRTEARATRARHFFSCALSPIWWAIHFI